MKNAPDVKERIKGTAAYITAAVLAVVFTLLARYADGALIKTNSAFDMAELTAEAIIVVFAVLYLYRHRSKEKVKKGKYVIIAAVPVLLALAACFHIPRDFLSSSGAASVTDIFLSSLTDDLILCGLGCTILIHKCRFGASGVVLMLLCMSSFEAAVCGHTGEELLIHTVAAAIIGYFEIYLHLSTESAAFCCAFRFLLNLSFEFTERYSVSGEPYVGEKLSTVFYIASLSAMLVLAVYMRTKMYDNKLTEEMKEETDNSELRIQIKN